MTVDASVATRADFEEIVQLIDRAKRDVSRAVNITLIDLYMTIGGALSRRIEHDGWGRGP